MTRLLVISSDLVDIRMAGPGVRYWEMAQALSASLEVTFATPDVALPGRGFTCFTYTSRAWDSLAPAVPQADVLMFPGELLIDFPQVATCGKPLIIEATSPASFESLEFYSRETPDRQRGGLIRCQETIRRMALAGDFFFSAGQRQRNYWIGVLDAWGRINPDTYADDPALYRLIDIVPFGLPSHPPDQTGPAMKGVIPGIGPTDRVVLWGGGLWRWLDPLSLVRAIVRVAEKRPDVRLVFPGTRRPNPVDPEMPMLRQVMELSDELGLTGRIIFFGDWVPYELWPNYLLEADIGASMHFDALETRFAFRTRMLDYIWAGLPMVVAGGDETSKLATQYGLGEVVPPGDEEAIAAAISRLLDVPNLREAYRQGFDRVRPQFQWENVCEPIVRFCEKPRFAPDRASGRILPRTPEETSLAFQVAQLRQEGEQQRAEIAQLQALVHGYEQGRFIRFMRQVHKWRRKLGL